MATPRTMRAAFIREAGSTEAIQIGELTVPQPGPTDVLVRMQASNVNHVDLFVRSGAFPTHTPFPFIIGRDLVGTVVTVGSGVASFATGDRVWSNSLGYGGRQGALAEYAVVCAERLYPLPDAADPTQAAAVLHTGATAHIGLVREAGLRPGETIFVEGAGGGVGSAIVQMASAIGARVIATAAPQDEDWCRSCGADVVFDYHHDDLYDQVQRAAPEGVDIWWDNSGRNDFTQCLPLLGFGGRAVLMSGLQGPNPTLPVGAMYTKEVTLYGFAISNASVSDLADAANTINHMLDAGQLRARIGKSFALEDAAKAHETMETGGIRGRVIVRP